MLWRAGQLGSLGTRRGSTLPPTELPLLNIIPPGALGHSAPQSLPLSAFPEMANPQRFLGSSLLAWHGLSLPISQPWHLSLMFRTRQADGVLLQAVTRGRSTITLQVMEGGMGQAGPGMGYWSELAGRGLSRQRKRQLGSFSGSLLPSLGPTGNNAFSSLASAREQDGFGGSGRTVGWKMS